VLYYIHGGGFWTHRADSFLGSLEAISLHLRAKIFSIDYRLAPEYPFPCGLLDCVKGYQYLINEHIPAGDIFFIGDSCGGNLVITTALVIKDRKDLPYPAGIIPVSAMTNLVFNYPSFTTNSTKDLFLFPCDGVQIKKIVIDEMKYIPPELYRSLVFNPLVSPVFGDLKGLPPMQIWVGRDEILCDDSVKFYEKCIEDGVMAELKVQEHGLHSWVVVYPYMDVGKEALNEVLAFIERIKSYQ